MWPVGNEDSWPTGGLSARAIFAWPSIGIRTPLSFYRQCSEVIELFGEVRAAAIIQVTGQRKALLFLRLGAVIRSIMISIISARNKLALSVVLRQTWSICNRYKK